MEEAAFAVSATEIGVKEGMADDAKPVAPFDLPDDKLVAHLMRWYAEAYKHKSPILKKRKVDHEMYAGKQWADADIQAGAKRVRLTLNMILNIIGAVEGEERTDRQEMKFYGNGADDDHTADDLNRLLKWIMQGCGGEFALSDQFRNNLIGGEGWIVPEVDYFEDPEGKIKLVFVDDSEIFDDPVSTCPVASDSRFICRVRQMAVDEIEARWPGSMDEIGDASLVNGTWNETDGKGLRDIYMDSSDTMTSPKLYDAQTKMWAVIEVWWYQIEAGWVVVNEENGLLEEKSPEEFEAMKAQREVEIAAARSMALQSVIASRMGQSILPGLPGAAPAMPMPQIPQPLQATQRPVKRLYQAFLCNRVLLGKNASPLNRLKRHIYVPVRAFLDRTNKEWFGLVRPITDVQKQHNVEQSVIVQLMQLMPKGSWMAPKGAFHNKVDWQNRLGMTGQLFEYNPSRGKPEPVPVPPIPRHLVDMAFTRPQTMRDISGVNVELTGQRQGSDAGVVMEMRKKAARTVLAPLFDNFRRSKIELGKVLLAYIQAYVSPARQIRVIGDEGPSRVIMTPEMQTGRYDVTVEETNSAVNDRMATLTILQTTLPNLLKMGVAVPPEFIDLMPMPVHVRDQWKRVMTWQMMQSGALPPPNWQIGDPIPFPAPPMGGAMPPDPNQPPA